MPALNFQKQFALPVLAGMVKRFHIDAVQRAAERDGFEDTLNELLADHEKIQPKTQTIRAFRKDGRDPKVGDTLYLYTGMMHKNCIKLGEVKCKSVSDIIIYENSIHERTQCTQGPMTLWQQNAVARDDGFDSFDDLVAWVKENGGLPFKGKLIKW